LVISGHTIAHCGHGIWHITVHTIHQVSTFQTQRRVVREPARDVPVHGEADVLVVGGGPAGCAAAVAAARVGARVTLVERYNHLGGLSTGGLVVWIDRMSSWGGKQVIAGFASELLARLPAHALAGPARNDWGSREPHLVAHWHPRAAAFRDTVTWSPTVDPEWLKLESARLLVETGVRLQLHSWAAGVCGARDDGGIDGVVFESKQGRRAILARVVVDATGDLDVCVAAGAAYESDLEDPSRTIQHCLNVSWTWAGVDVAQWLAFRREHPDQHRELLRRGRDELDLLELPHVGWRDDVALFMGPRLGGYSGLDVDDLTAVELRSREHMVAHLDFFRHHVPGFAGAWIAQTGTQVGVRHTRRLVGVRPLRTADWRSGARHADEVGVSPPPSERFADVSVPYGCLVPEGLANVLVAGRHIACDAQSQAFMREIPQCWLTGQAAGAAAALAAAAPLPVRDVPVRALQAELRRQGVFLHT